MSRAGDAMYYATGDGSSLDFDKSSSPVAFDDYATGGTSPDFAGKDYYSEVYAESASGKVLIARVATGVHVRGADCTFSGLFQA